MALYLGDLPPGPIEIDPPVEIGDLDVATAVVVDPLGVESGATATIAEDTGYVEVVIPGPSPFTVAGLYSLRVVLTSGSSQARVTLPPVSIIVQDPDSGWHTLDSAREGWADAAHVPDRILFEILEQARLDVLSYAPALAVDAPIPAHYRKGQKAQARNILDAGLVAPSGDMGDQDFVIRPFPLDWHVQQTLRPKRARGAIR